jgi:hypothetical protein
MSFFIRAIDNYLDSDLPPIDATVAPWQGVIGSTHTNWVTGNLVVLLTDTTTAGTTRTELVDTSLSLTPNALIGYTLTYTSGPAAGQSQLITANTGGLGTSTITTVAFQPPPFQPTPTGGDTFEVSQGWTNTLPFTLIPNAGSALSTYAAQNYQTLWINPQTTGGIIDPNHPPSYLVSIYAVDPITNTYASCSFTLVILPSVAEYGLGVSEVIYGVDGFVFGNSVQLLSDGYSKTPKNSATVNFNFYPLESTTLVPNKAPAPVTISLNYFNAGTSAGGIIDDDNSTINGISFDFYNSGAPIVLPQGFTRDFPSASVELVVYLNSHASATDGVSIHSHTLVMITGTDTNGVTASAYLIIQVSE